MKYRFFAPVIAEITTLAGDEFHHAARVVRVVEGEDVELFDGRGAIVAARVETLGRDHIILRTTGTVTDSRESPLVTHLAMAIINLDRFEIALQKATELGVRSIIPMITERVEIRPERYRGKRERWEKIIFEAVKQSGRGRVPLLEESADFADVMSRPGMRFLFDADWPSSPTPAAISEVTLCIGPEGGWGEEELELAQRNGAIFQRLGPRRLRAETAAIAACTIVASRYGDL